MWPFIRKIFNFAIPAIASIAVAILISFLIKKHYHKIPDGDEDFSKCSLARSGEIGYHVSIQLDSEHLCSGSLIHKKYVLTAAHCVYRSFNADTYKTKMKIFVGTRTLPGGTSYDVDLIKLHHLYDSKKSKNDIAVVRLREEVSDVYDVKTISLPDNETIPEEGLELLASGYHFIRTKNPDIKSDQHTFSMKIVDGDTCQKHFSKYIDMFGKFCAIASPGFKPCLGDDGSPATLDRNYIIGIHSDIFDCDKRQPELFIDVSSYFNFITSAMA